MEVPLHECRWLVQWGRAESAYLQNGDMSEALRHDLIDDVERILTDHTQRGGRLIHDVLVGSELARVGRHSCSAMRQSSEVN
jgi:hypothetical protein